MALSQLLEQAVWSILIACIGFGGTQLLKAWIIDLHRHEHWIVGMLLLLALGSVARRWIPLRRRA